MKSVTIKDKFGRIIIKVIHRANGNYDMLIDKIYAGLEVDVEVRDYKNQKVTFGGKK